MLTPTSALVGYFGMDNVPPLATDGRFSGGSKGILIAHLPEAYKNTITSILKDGDKIKKVTWGDTTGLSVKLKDPEARKSFAARHQCAQQKDRTKPAYWACNLPRYAKSLGMSGGGNFFW